MAYRFKDSNGDWRIRYDDGSTSPVIGNVSSVLQDSNFNFSDDSIGGKNTYGVDKDFSSTKKLLEGAIIERQASKQRVATYQNEFQPLADTPQGQDILISSVASNANADMEARAGAFQALYPGMQAEIGNNGELSFTAKNSDLGFKYPDKTAAQVKQDQTAANSDPSSKDPASVLGMIRDTISGIQTAPDQVTATTMLSDAIGATTTAIAERKKFYKDQFNREYNVGGLEQALKQERMLDTQAKLADPRAAGMGDSGATKQVLADLALAQQYSTDAVNEALGGDSELAQLSASLEQLKMISTNLIGKMGQETSLIPEAEFAAINASFNQDGSPMTAQQIRELNLRVGNDHAPTMGLIRLATVPIPQMVQVAMTLPNEYQGQAERMFENALGTEGKGLYKEIKDGINNFDAYLAKNSIFLDKATRDKIKESTPQAGRSYDKDQKAQMESDLVSTKSNVILQHLRDMRDLKAGGQILSGESVPEQHGDLWRAAVADVKATQEITRRQDLAKIEGEFAITAEAKLERAKRAQEFKDKPITLTNNDLSKVVSRFAEMYYNSEFATGDPGADMLAVDMALTKWLTSQAENPILKNLLGENISVSAPNVRALATYAYSRAAADRMESYGSLANYSMR